MINKIEFQFDDKLEYQLHAVESTVNLFKGLPQKSDSLYKICRKGELDYAELSPIRNPSISENTKLLANLNAVQYTNDLFADTDIGSKNFTIEMETGTGKTYVYLRTILALHKEYDFKKFIIVVPSIAILKGVKKSIEQLKKHFEGLFNIDVEKYSSIDAKSTSEVLSKFVESTDLSILIMNTQLFNKENNILRKENENGQIVWDEMKRIRPIVIMDEPQKMEGSEKKASKTLEALDYLEPLFFLRYSATHKQLFHQIYKLDSFDAYSKKLVKRIQVKTVNGIPDKNFPFIRYVQFTKDLKAQIEIFSQEQGGLIKNKIFNVENNASLSELSGNLSQYENMRVIEQPHKEKNLKISFGNTTIELEQGESHNGFTEKQCIEIQIHLAIKNHFEKQFAILDSGKKIKAITLFFIDAVKNVRDPEQEDGRGEYLRIFDKKYSEYISSNKDKIEKYADYFKGYDNVLQVREGYFAVDKNKSVQEVEYDKKGENVKTKSQEDIDRGVQLILDKKDELISFEEPLSFIFSHSALREGWDNPNVFTLCTLKRGSNEIAKKQEIGRGLRLPVDIKGKRCLDSSINELTVIANDSYEHFSETLQKDYNEESNFKVHEITPDILRITLVNAGVPEAKITPELVTVLKKEFVENDICDNKNILKNEENLGERLYDIFFEDETLQEHKQKIVEEFKKAMKKRGSKRIEIKNGDIEHPTNEMRSFFKEESFYKFFIQLSNYLKKRTFYKSKIDKDDFIQKCVDAINLELTNFSTKQSFSVTESKGKFIEVGSFELEKTGEPKSIPVGIKAAKKSDFEIINYIMYHTMLPRLAIIKIMQKIEKRVALNFQDILEKVSQIIKKQLDSSKGSAVTEYETIDKFELDKELIFALDEILESDLTQEKKEKFLFEAKAKSNALNKYYKFDSEGEKKFALQLEKNDNILLFTKLKKGGFVIDTPHGNYTPDWAIICKEDGVKDPNIGIYFIVETKADKKWDDLSDVEKHKIRCAKLHFKAIDNLITYDWVNSYKDFTNKFNVKEYEYTDAFNAAIDNEGLEAADSAEFN